MLDEGQPAHAGNGLGIAGDAAAGGRLMQLDHVAGWPSGSVRTRGQEAFPNISRDLADDYPFKNR